MFFHPDDKINGDIDRIDQMMWAEVPINFQSKEFDEYLDTWRHADDDRTQFWRVKEVEMKKVTLPFFRIFSFLIKKMGHNDEDVLNFISCVFTTFYDN